MTIRKLAIAGAFALALAALSGCSDDTQTSQTAQSSSTPVIGVVQLVEHPALDAANRGIVDAVKARGLTVEFDQQNAQADQSNLGNIAQRFVSQKYPLIFAIATPAAQTMANATDTTPIVATAVTNFEVAKLVKSNDKPETNVTGTSDLNPVAEQVKLMLALVPEAKRIGTIYNSSEINSQFQAPAGIPVITGEEGCLQGGGLATVGVDYYNLGRIAGEMGADILEGKSKPQDMAIRHQTEFKVKINKKVAETLGINVPESIAKSAEFVNF